MKIETIKYIFFSFWFYNKFQIEQYLEDEDQMDEEIILNWETQILDI